MKCHNRFTMSSVIQSIGCLSAVFRINDPVLALLLRATSGRQTPFDICNVPFGHLLKRTGFGDTGVFNCDSLGSSGADAFFGKSKRWKSRALMLDGSETHDRAFSS